MKALSVARALVGAAVVVITQIVVRTALGLLYRAVPENHAFWSGLALYAELLSLPLLPLVLVPFVLRGRCHRTGRAGALISAWSIVVLFTSPVGGSSEIWLKYWTEYAAGVFIVFAVAVRSRRRHDH